MNTDAFQKFSTKYGLDSEIVASFCESFATHVDLPKEKCFKYHPSIKEEIKEPLIARDETIIYNVDLVVPTAYIEKPPFPVRVKEHSKVSTMVNKILENLNPMRKSKWKLMFLWLRISWKKI